MITLVGGIKGGTGKTTIATNLAAMFAADSSKKTVLVDADRQGSANDWHLTRLAISESAPGKYHFVYCETAQGMALRNNAERWRNSRVVIDCGGSDSETLRSAMTIADLMIVPFRPGAFDVWALSDLSKLLEPLREINPNIYVLGLMNAADPRGGDNSDALKAASNIPGIAISDVIITHRRAYRAATSEGVSVIEWRNNQRKRCTKSIKEMNALFTKIKMLGGLG